MSMLSMTSLNYNVEPHKYLEILRGGDKVIVLYSDDGSLITKEIHAFNSAPQTKGFVEPGMIIESITTEQASGSWEDRYELDYVDPNAPAEEEPPAEPNNPSDNPTEEGQQN